MQARMWRKDNSHTQLVGMWISTATTENRIKFPLKKKRERKLKRKINLPYDLAFSLWGIYKKGNYISITKKRLHTHVCCCTIHKI
jgi:hypothetical protein